MYLVTIFLILNFILFGDFSITLSKQEEQSFKKYYKRLRREAIEIDNKRWSVINDQVDIVIPLLLKHLEKLDVDYLQLPNTKETITVKPLLISHEAELHLSNGIAYNIGNLQRNGDAYMTYENKSFLCQMNLKINSLEFKYDFLIKYLFVEAYGKVLGYLDDVIIFLELQIKFPELKLQLNDFRIVNFNRVEVQLDEVNFVGEITRIILSPIVNMFKERITTTFSDGIKDQIQIFIDDYNQMDPLELNKFTKQLTTGLSS